MFSKEEAALENLFLTRILDKYSQRITICILILSMDCIIRELLVLFDVQLGSKLYAARITGLLLGILSILSTAVSIFQKNPIFFKYFIFGIVAGRFILRLSEIFYFVIIAKDTFRVVQVVSEMANLYQVESIFLNAVGLFYFRDIIVHSIIYLVFCIPLTHIYLVDTRWFIHTEILIAFVYTLVDGYLHFSREIESFKNLIYIERKSLRLSQFVNRLLPKHVKIEQLILDPRPDY